MVAFWCKGSHPPAQGAHRAFWCVCTDPRRTSGFCTAGGGADVSAVGRGLAWHVAAVWRGLAGSGAAAKGTPFPPPPPVCVWVPDSIFPPFFLKEVL